MNGEYWWPYPPPTLNIVDAAIATGNAADAADRGWFWARATRDACVSDWSPAHAAWHRAAEVCWAIVAYDTRMSEARGVLVREEP